MAVPLPSRSFAVQRHISVPTVSVIYILFAALVYWPVLAGARFFWEDFFNQEYPIREYCYYAFGLRHTLPFWNPYSWGWSPLLSDAQSGFWYPGNLLGIAITRLISPHAAHLPIIIPEIITLIHMVLGALGMFCLSKRVFIIPSLFALLSGFVWGFGLRMVAEQNHSMQIIQLSLLPWEVLLLIKSWNSWGATIMLGLLFGVSFFAGQPQTFFFIGIFMAAFALAEVIRRFHSSRTCFWARPAVAFIVMLMIALGTAAIQLLPSNRLVSCSLRSCLPYEVSSVGSMPIPLFLDFLVPKLFGENPGFTILKSDIVQERFWYWEAVFYFGALAEIMAVFGAIQSLKRNEASTPASKYARFFILFSTFALLYSTGNFTHFSWLFWRFVPCFDHIRAPNRMLWFVWFTGALYSGVGFTSFFNEPDLTYRRRRFFYVAALCFFAATLLGMSGVFDLLHTQHIRHGIASHLLNSAIVSIALLLFFFWYFFRRPSIATAVTAAFVIVLGDLYYLDHTWYRNTLSRETIVAQDSASPSIRAFADGARKDHSQLMWLERDSVRKMKSGLGMFLRLPIEYAIDTVSMTAVNPLRITRMFPPVKDSIARMAIMGVRSLVVDSIHQSYPGRPLPFLKLYHGWVTANSDSETARILNDSAFDFHRTIVIDSALLNRATTPNDCDTADLLHYSENNLLVHTTPGSDAVLLINDLYYSAWRASIDGKPSTIMRGFTSLRALFVPAGKHTIEMFYDDAAFAVGWKITLATIALSICGLLLISKSHKT